MKTNHAKKLRDALQATAHLRHDMATIGKHGNGVTPAQWRWSCYALAGNVLGNMGYSGDEIDAALLRELGGEARRHPGRPSETPELKIAVSVMLTRSAQEAARRIGGGCVSRGIREALRGAMK